MSQRHTSGGAAATQQRMLYDGRDRQTPYAEPVDEGPRPPALGGRRPDHPAWRRELIAQLYADSGDPT